jgi:hypothetical protein
MIEKYCPAGKCKCEHYQYWLCFAGNFGKQTPMYFEVCPWPSRQQPIQQTAEPVIIPDAAEICNKTAVQNCHACPKFNCGDNMVNKSNRTFYAAGRAEGVRECREAVKKIKHTNTYWINGVMKIDEVPVYVDVILAALEGVKGDKNG